MERYGVLVYPVSSKTLTIMENLNGKKGKKIKEKIVHNMVVLTEKNVWVFTKNYANFFLSIHYLDIVFM